jgi:hypothetical protein
MHPKEVAFNYSENAPSSDGVLSQVRACLLCHELILESFADQADSTKRLQELNTSHPKYDFWTDGNVFLDVFFCGCAHRYVEEAQSK